MSNATKETILAARSPRLAPVPVEVPELGGTVYVARMNARQADQYAKELKDAADDCTRGAILANALASEAGDRLFSAADAAALAELPNAAAEAVIEAFSRENGLGKKG